ncbi:maleylpyruvate isomerase family mycothiol-dependent enzyme [Streptomyces sp. NPDC004610]|uniref:maleylpyruvate isomerase family mycothiol-dependent enzyme n=1 Tax=unclassified Streptomyces TaxID=2593676 RepID=UPI0033BB46E7
MDTTRFLTTLDDEGESLAVAAERAGTDAPVPTCPDWRVRDLLLHAGTVHRWAARFVAEGIREPRRPSAPPELDGTDLVAWFRDGHRTLVGTLTRAAPDTDCWAFLPAPSPLAFWRRRQAHETTVHRFDAESALGATPSPIDTDFAVDGIDELLRGFHARKRSRVRTPEPRVLRIRATDADAVWTVRLSQEPPVATRGEGAGGSAESAGSGRAAECELSGPAARLYLALWNRVPVPAISGDTALARLWRETSGI